MGNTSSSGSSHGSGGSTSHGQGSGFSHHNFSSSFKKSSGLLGLSRSELDKRCKPSGLYPECLWEDKAIRKLIGDGRLAARVRGDEERVQSNSVECPICFLYYNQVNVTDCCAAFCCTECFLQLKPPDGKKNGSETSSTSSSSPSKKSNHHRIAQAGCDCPFCNAPRVAVKMSTNQANLSKIAEREEEEQRIIEAKIRASLEANNNSKTKDQDRVTPLLASDENNDDSNYANEEHRFGQSLSRLTSFKEETHDGLLVTSADERKRLEDEMKQQHQHPLVRRIQQEAEEASNARAAAYARSSSDLSGRRTRLGRYGAGRSSFFHRARSERGWSSMLEGQDFPSLDDLVVLEAAIMLSMEDEARTRGNGDGDGSGNSSNENTSDGSNRAGQPLSLLQALMSRSGGGGGGGIGQSLDESDENSSSDNGDGSSSSGNNLGGLSSSRSRVTRGLSRMSSSRRRRRRNRMLGLAGMTEDEQVAVAIAMSLRESSAAASATAGDNQDGDEEQNGDGADEQGGESNTSPTNENSESTVGNNTSNSPDSSS